MTTDTFRADIDRILVESWQARRAELVQSPRYRAEIDAARTEATKEERAREGNVNERIATAKQLLATIDQRIDQETGLVFGGRMQRIEAMVTLLQNSPSAWVVVTFWLLIGALPNLLMLAAQFRCLTTTSSLRSWPPNKPRSWQR
jgi:hypothetical protein